MTSLTQSFLDNLQSQLYTSDLAYNAKKFALYNLLYGIGFGLGFGLIFFNYSFEYFAIAFAGVFITYVCGVYALLVVTANHRTAVMDEVLPDFLGLMASNIKSGLTYDRALLASARREFGPLSKEIDRAAKETFAGMPLSDALMGMSKRSRSEVFAKTARLIVEGVNSGGNLGELLETTSKDIRRFSIMRKEVSATVLVYQLFMVAAVAFGAPLIYGVSTFLISVISDTKSKISSSVVSSGSYLPFFGGGSSAPISPDVVFYFAIGALFITSLFGAFAIGVISKGKESEGLTYFPILLGSSMGVFFLTRFILGLLTTGLFV